MSGSAFISALICTSTPQTIK